jgi:pilus assembly protein CpaB
MLLRPFIAVILLLGSAGLGWVAYKAANPTQLATPKAVAGVPVKLLVAAQPLQAGTLLKGTDLRELDVPPDAVPDGSFIATDDARAEIRGAMLRHYLDAGAPFARPTCCARVTAASPPSQPQHPGGVDRCDCNPAPPA